MIDLHITEIGSSSAVKSSSEYVLETYPMSEQAHYSDAQVTSYSNRSEINITKPARMELKARFEGSLAGTAGFGFWNHPLMSNWRSFRMPKAVWFFYGSSHNNIHLAKGIPGSGWKVGTINSTRWQFWALLPTAPIGFLLMRIPFIYDRLWRVGQDALGLSESLLDASLMDEWHTYRLDWLRDSVEFFVDDRLVHRTNYSPKGKLGFIAWIDNQYAIVTPQGQFGGGVIDSKYPQKLYLQDIHVKAL